MLHKFAWEVEAFMPPNEYADWLAFLKLEEESREKERRESSNRQKLSGGGGRRLKGR